MITNYRSSPTLEAYISITTCVVAYRENRGVNRYRCAQHPPRIPKTNALSYASWYFASIVAYSERQDVQAFAFIASPLRRNRFSGTTFANLPGNFGTLACILFAYYHEPTQSIKDSCRHLMQIEHFSLFLLSS